MTAADLKQLAAEAETAETAKTLERTCEIVGIGPTILISRDRSRDTAKRRAVVAWILHDRLRWPASRVAAVLKRTKRQVHAMVRQERS